MFCLKDSFVCRTSCLLRPGCWLSRIALVCITLHHSPANQETSLLCLCFVLRTQQHTLTIRMSDDAVTVEVTVKPASDQKNLKPCCACQETKKPRDKWCVFAAVCVLALANRRSFSPCCARGRGSFIGPFPTHTHARTHARKHARTHARTQARTQAHALSLSLSLSLPIL